MLHPLLALLFALSASYPAVAAGGLRVRAPHAWACCEENLVEVDPESVYEVGAWEAPSFHAFNLDASLAALKEQEQAELRRVEAAPGASFLCAEPYACFAITDEKKLRSRVRFRVRDLLGRRYEFKARADEKDPSLFRFKPARLRARRRESVAPEERLLNLWKIYAKEAYWEKSNEELALTLHYIFYSTSTRARKNPHSTELEDGIRRAHERFAENLHFAGSLGVDDLEYWNYQLSRGPGDAPASAGVLRGSRGRAVEINGVLYLVDLRRAEVSQGTEGEAAVRLNPFTPAAHVQAALENLLARVNMVNEGTAPTLIFALYREFILIHPFSDRNGGTGRLLLNHMLLRAGLPPTLQPAESLYFSDEELFFQYSDRWEKKTRRSKR